VYSTNSKRKSNDYKTKENPKYAYKSKTSKAKVEPILSPRNMRDDIVLTALKYTGRPYKSAGKSPEGGFDCSGFTSFVYKSHGIDVSGPSDHQAKLGKPKDKEKLEAGDLVFFGNEERISHVGIVASHQDQELQIVHSTTSAGVKVDNISHSEYWQSRFLFGIDVIKK
jgi:cell wall-associated NlpC family hydrolase